jgi:dihydropteroate synthase
VPLGRGPAVSLNDEIERVVPLVAAIHAASVLTHSLSPPRSEPPRPQYGDVTSEVVAFLCNRVERAVDAAR